jgi:hypothetical protein
MLKHENSAFFGVRTSMAIIFLTHFWNSASENGNFDRCRKCFDFDNFFMCSDSNHAASIDAFFVSILKQVGQNNIINRLLGHENEIDQSITIANNSQHQGIRLGHPCRRSYMHPHFHIYYVQTQLTIDILPE